MVGAEFLDEGDQGNHLGLGQVIAQIVALEIILGGQVNAGLHERGGDFLGLSFNAVEDFVLVHHWPRHAELHLDGNLVRQGLDVFRIGILVEEPRVSRHVGAFRDLAGIEEMIEVPVIAPDAGAHVLELLALGILGKRAALAGKIRTRALGTPLVGMVEDRFAKVGVVIGNSRATVAHDIPRQGADHLGVAEVAALGDIDVAAGEFERRVNNLKAAFDVFLAVDDEGGDDLDGTADGRRHKDQHGEGQVVVNEPLVPVGPGIVG